MWTGEWKSIAEYLLSSEIVCTRLSVGEGKKNNQFHSISRVEGGKHTSRTVRNGDIVRVKRGSGGSRVLDTLRRKLEKI
jgi:hypothetical protein